MLTTSLTPKKQHSIHPSKGKPQLLSTSNTTFPRLLRSPLGQSSAAIAIVAQLVFLLHLVLVPHRWSTIEGKLVHFEWLTHSPHDSHPSTNDPVLAFSTTHSSHKETPCFYFFRRPKALLPTIFHTLSPCCKGSLLPSKTSSLPLPPRYPLYLDAPKHSPPPPKLSLLP